MNSEERSNEERLMVCVECEHIEGRCVCDCDDDVPSVPLPENRCGSCEQHIRVAVLGARLAAVERERDEARADAAFVRDRFVKQGEQHREDSERWAGTYVEEASLRRQLSDVSIERDAALARIADYEHRISWDTACGNCARMLDTSIKDYERASSALARIAAVEAERDAALDRIVAVRAWRTRWGTRGPIDMWMEFDDSLAALAASPTPTGPEPARCEHKRTEAHQMLDEFCEWTADCPGPATPEPTEETP